MLFWSSVYLISNSTIKEERFSLFTFFIFFSFPCFSINCVILLGFSFASFYVFLSSYATVTSTILYILFKQKSKKTQAILENKVQINNNKEKLNKYLIGIENRYRIDLSELLKAFGTIIALLLFFAGVMELSLIL